MQEMMGDVTTELLLKLQTVIDKQSITDRFTFQSGTVCKLSFDTQFSKINFKQKKIVDNVVDID